MGTLSKIAIYGAGGFAREVAWLLSTQQNYDVIGHIEDEIEHERIVNSKPVMSWQTFSDRFKGTLVTVAVGNPHSRKLIVTKCDRLGASFATLVDTSVKLSKYVEIGVGSIICCGTIMTVNINIARHVHINLDCTIGHDVQIDEYTTIAPGVHISGNVQIGKCVYIGTGATVINGSPERPLIIADNTVIAAGACITRNTEANCLYAGVPAVVKKHLL